MSLVEQAVKGPVRSRQTRDDLRDADHGKLPRVHRGLHSSVTHGLAAAAEDFDFPQTLGESSGEPRAIHVTRTLARHHHQTRL